MTRVAPGQVDDVALGEELDLPVDGGAWWPDGLAAAVDTALRERIAGYQGIAGWSLPEAWWSAPPADGLRLVLAEWWPAGMFGPDQLVWRLEAEPGRPPFGEVRAVQRPEVGLRVGVRPQATVDEITGPLPAGERYTASYRVTDAELTGHVAGRPPVLSTPALLGWLEQTAQRLTLPHLSPRFTTVGVRLDVQHRAAAYRDETVTVTAILTGRYRRRLCYLVEAAVGERQIGVGRHHGHVVPHH